MGNTFSRHSSPDVSPFVGLSSGATDALFDALTLAAVDSAGTPLLLRCQGA